MKHYCDTHKEHFDEIYTCLTCWEQSIRNQERDRIIELLNEVAGKCTKPIHRGGAMCTCDLIKHVRRNK